MSSKYQDYVIKNGKLIGKFEEMYQNHNDPWAQTKEIYESDKAILKNFIQSYCSEQNKQTKIIEIGCGLGHFSYWIKSPKTDILGTDISKTAIQKAKSQFEGVTYKEADFNEYKIYDEFKPDIFILSEITWYVLDSLNDFLKYIKQNHKNKYFLHTLTTYPVNTQRYGKNHFTNIEEILEFFNLDVIEYGTCNKNTSETTRTYFIAKI